MRIYLSVDLEGIAGVAHPAQTSFGPGRADRTDYDRCRTLMAEETNSAVQAALDAGAREVVVNDSHWQMRNLRADELHPAARLIVGTKPYSMTEGIDGQFDAALFVGYHAGGGHPSGVLAHTYSSASVVEVRINGVAHNEAALNAIRLGGLGVPVALVSGDDALMREVKQLLPWAERVTVKRAVAEHVADSLAPERAREAIAIGVRQALARLPEMRPYLPEPPLTVELDLRQPIMAAFCAVIPAVKRIGPATVRVSAAEPDTAYRWLLTLVRIASVATA
jgi:D-amino peptidase